MGERARLTIDGGAVQALGEVQNIALDGFYSKQDYPQHLRRVSFCDPETGKRLVFLTNNFTLSAEMIAALYKKRWAVELFFKWVKQNRFVSRICGQRLAPVVFPVRDTERVR